MRLLTSLTMVGRLALFDKVPRSETIHTKLVGAQKRELVCVSHGLELLTQIERMLTRAA